MFATLKTSLAVAICACTLAAGAENANLYLDVPFIPQEKDGCGAAVIAMVMQYWQQSRHQPLTADAVQIQRELYNEKARGIYASDLEKYFQSHDFKTYTFKGQWQDFEQHLKKGRPLIVALKPGGAAPLHYVVVAGLDQSNGLILVNDPAQRKLLKQSRSTFEREWQSAGNWTLLALPNEAASSAQ